MRATSFALIAALGVIAAAGCANPAQPQGDYGSVAGVVTASGGPPIAGASVCIFVVECVTTAADGTYKISTVPADPAGTNETITASATGYANASQQVHITAGQQTPANFTLTKT